MDKYEKELKLKDLTEIEKLLRLIIYTQRIDEVLVENLGFDMYFGFSNQ